MGTLENIWRAATDDLLSWEEEEDRLLPGGMTPEQIADLEEDSFIVDLLTGEVSVDPDAAVQS